MMADTANPYGAFADYWDAGWRDILPLPHRKKKSPPDGYTGYSGRTPSYADCHAWSEDGTRNICLRMPGHVVGIDVDNYAGKPGAATLADLVAKYGPLPPTWMSTSREDGISGIRFYRIPDGATLPTKLPGIEFIQRHHRYAVVWPSEHPETGRTYTWVDETDPAATAGVPNLGSLPELPATWLAGLLTESSEAAKADVDPARVLAVIDAMPPGDPCPHIRAGAGHAAGGGDRHDSYNAAVLAVASAGRDGCPGAKMTLQRLRAAFIAEVTQTGTSSRRTQGEAEAEWSRSLVGAIAIVADRPQGTACPDDAYAYLVEHGALDVQDDTGAGSDQESEGEAAYRATVARKAAELQILDDARDLNAARVAAGAPPIVGINLADFLAQPDEPVRYRVADLWPSNGRTLLVAAAKAGKTTMLARNLIPALTAGGTFLGRFDVQPVTGTIVYLNLEVSESTIRAWMRNANIPHPEKVVVVNLRGRAGALNLSSAHGRARFAKMLAGEGCEVLIADPLAPLLAAHNLVEDSNSDVAKFFAWWSEALADAGVTDDLIAHHAGHAGQRSRGASRLLDEPDAVWTVTKAQAHSVDDDEILAADDRRFLAAVGRDVDLAESGLDFDSATGLLSIVDGSGPQLRRQAQDAAYEKAVLEALAGSDGNPLSTRDIVKSGGNEGKMKAALGRLVERGEVDALDLGRGRMVMHSLPYRATETRGVATVAKVSPGDSGDTWCRPVANPLATPGVARPYRGDTSTGEENQDLATPNAGDMPTDADLATAGVATPLQATLGVCDGCGKPSVTNPCSTCRATA